MTTKQAEKIIEQIIDLDPDSRNLIITELRRRDEIKRQQEQQAADNSPTETQAGGRA
ncbi:MAG: hypothetical protein IJ181_10015 [Acidaminococcaceae bacterium]|nr:hypothetical protein [Acidaminococcaceae bacterium]